MCKVDNGDNVLLRGESLMSPEIRHSIEFQVDVSCCWFDSEIVNVMVRFCLSFSCFSGNWYSTTIDCAFSNFDFHVSLTQVVEGNAYNSMYVRNILKKIILAAESTSEVIMDGLYEQLTLHMTLHTVIHVSYLFSSPLAAYPSEKKIYIQSFQEAYLSI